MIALLKDMFHRGNPIDTAWFLAGAWILLFFLGAIGYQIFRKIFPRR